MYKLIIVEDELFVRIGLENAVNWKDFDIEIAASVSNGKEGLAAYEEHKPDIIITDIKMPVMDGLAMLKEIRQQNKDVKFIIVSCLEDFKLAQKALSYSVSDYLIKHELKTEELKTIIGNMCKDLSKKYNNAANNDVSHEEKPEYYSYEDAKNKLSLKNYNIMACLIVDYGSKKTNEIVKTINDTVEKLMKNQSNGTLFYSDKGNIFLVYCFELYTDKEKEETEKNIIHLIRMVRMYFNLDVTSILSPQFKTLNRIDILKQNLEDLAALPFYYKDKKLLYANEDAKYAMRNMQKEVQKIKKQYINCFGEEYAKEFEDFAQMFNNAVIEDTNSIKDMVCQWLNMFMAVMHITTDKTDHYALDVYRKVQNAKNMQDAADLFCEYIFEVHKHFNEASKISSEITMATDYIKGNLDKNLSLADVAAYVNFSTGYLGALFKRDLDMSFTEFVLKTRIKKAKYLLIQTNEKIYDIAKQVGMSDQSYFNKVFKKQTGYTPSKYRAMFHSKGEGV